MNFQAGIILRRQNNRQIGDKKEEFVCEWLGTQGYRIVERNFRCRSGEIDIVAREGAYLVFIEVKYRRGAVAFLVKKFIGRGGKRNVKGRSNKRTRKRDHERITK